MKALAIPGLVLSALLSLSALADSQPAATKVETNVDVDHINFAFNQNTLSVICPQDQQPYSLCVGSMAVALVVDGDKQALSGNYVVSAQQFAMYFSADTIKEKLFNRISRRLGAIKNKLFGDGVHVSIDGDKLSIGGVNAQAEAVGRVRMWIGTAGAFVQQGSVWVSQAENSVNQAAANVDQARKEAFANMQKRVNEAGAQLSQGYQDLKDRAGQVAREKAKQVRDRLNEAIGDQKGTKDPQPKNP